MSTIVMHRTRLFVAALVLALFGLKAEVYAATKVAVIDGGELFPETQGQLWCSFLNNNGYECTLFPITGPTSSLDSFALVIDMSDQWNDGGLSLNAYLQSGHGVITWGDAPGALGIDTNPIVQEMIGANSSSWGPDSCRTTMVDPIFGSLPIGTELTHCGKFGCLAVDDITGHSNARVLARLNGGQGSIAVLRNRLGAGGSIYFSDAITVDSSLHQEIVLRALSELSIAIPASSAWGCLAFALAIAAAGSVLLRLPAHNNKLRARRNRCG